MLDECMHALNLKDGGIYFDGTLGYAGHTEEILKRTVNAKIIATDLDVDAVKNAELIKEKYPGRLTVVHENFKNFSAVMDALNIDKIDGALLDLGVSSVQLDERERGFSYLGDGAPLDMRMNVLSGITAKDIVNEYTEKAIAKILFDYGEERFAANIARNICEYRKNTVIETCGQLVEIIEKSIPKKFQQNGHPAKKTFQALRIAVNGELDGLDEAIRDITERLKKGGRLAVITFHSLEDRIVKNVFKDLETDCVCDKSLPVCVCGRVRKINILTKKPVVAGEGELEFNSRSKSAKLRVAERV